ncbi:MAG TPA: TonB-dependent receptor [Steroidobacteraceae bacterium]|jgi:iron complex outermembrane receptor protein|nr:TonB-dependent receptor [Steroidobacteraceae bacterium]
MSHRKVATVVSAAVALAVIVWLPSRAVRAQDAQNGQTPAAQNDQSGQVAQNAATAGALQEVVVTAERRATDVQTTPIAVTAISGQQLTELHLNDISDLQTTVPSFQVMDEAGYFNDMNIRGMGQTTNQPIVAPGVAVFRDGLLMAEPIAQDEPLFDIHDTEVLEGPQGTFVGASSTAGAVEINTNDPTFNGLHGYVDSQLGNYSDVKVDGAVNLPVSDTFAARLAFNSEQRHSFYSDAGSVLTPGQPEQSITDPGHVDNRQVRLSMLWKPTDKFQALGKFEYSEIETGGEPAEPNPATYSTLFGAGAQAGGINAGCTGGVAGSPQLVCALPGTVAHSQYYYPGELPFVLNYYGTNQEETEYQQHFGLELRYTLDNGIVLRSLTGHVWIDIDHIDNNSYGPQNAGEFYHLIGGGPGDNYYSEQLEAISPTTGKFNWIAGGFWMYRDTPVFVNVQSVSAPYLPYTLPGVDVLAGSSAVERIMGLYGQLNWEFTDTLQLSVGVRGNWDNNFNYNNPNYDTNLGATTPTTEGTGTYLVHYNANNAPSGYTLIAESIAQGHYSDSVPTGKVNLSWTPVTGQNFYVFYARGYKSGGVNASSTDHPTFGTETVNDYEAGWKGRLLDGRLLTQVGLYYIAYDGLQDSIFDADENNDTTTGDVVENLTPSKIYGIEVSEQAKIGHFGVNMGLDYNHSALGAIEAVPDYALPPGFNSPLSHPQCLGATPTPGCFNYTPYEVNVSGEENPYGPEITANVSVDYAIPVGNGALDPRVTFSHTDKQYVSIFETPYNEMGSRNLWNGNLDYVTGRWNLQLYATNIFNKTYVLGNTGTDVFYGAPRQFGFHGTYTF